MLSLLKGCIGMVLVLQSTCNMLFQLILFNIEANDYANSKSCICFYCRAYIFCCILSREVDVCCILIQTLTYLMFEASILILQGSRLGITTIISTDYSAHDEENPKYNIELCIGGEPQVPAHEIRVLSHTTVEMEETD
ncbi:hypothetical protein Droror1_Dr00002471 [Drosera rotundifolia]